jgi:hypothetical protein
MLVALPARSIGLPAPLIDVTDAGVSGDRTVVWTADHPGTASGVETWALVVVVTPSREKSNSSSSNAELRTSSRLGGFSSTCDDDTS